MLDGILVWHGINFNLLILIINLCFLGPDLEQEFKFFEMIDSCDIQKLLHCLTDTFEDNKREAAGLLIACSKHETSKLFLVSS